MRRLGVACAYCALIVALGTSPALAEELADESPLTSEPVAVATDEEAGDAAAPTDPAAGSYDDQTATESTTHDEDTAAYDTTEVSDEVASPDAGEVQPTDEDPSLGEEAQSADDGVTPSPAEGEMPEATIDDATPAASDTTQETVVSEIAQAPGVEDKGNALKSQATTTPGTSTSTTAALTRPANGTYVIKMDATQKLVLTVSGKSATAGSNVVAATYTGKSGQKWVVIYDAARKRYRLFVAGTDQKLALGAKKSGNGVNVCVLSAKKSLKSILWTFVCAKDGTYRLANAAFTGKRLDVAGAKVKKGANVIIAAKAAEGSNQTQRYGTYNANPKVKAGKTQLEGSYKALLESSQKVCVSVKGSSAAAGANVLLGKDADGTTQRFYFERDAKGFYSVWVIGSGKVLDVKDASVLPGANVLQAANTQKDSQKWAVIAQANGDGTYTVTLQNKATGLFLGAAKKAAGANLTGVDGSDASKIVTFRLRKRDMLDAGIYEIKPTATSKVSLNVSHALADNTKKGSIVLYTDKDSLAERFELVDATGDNVWRVRTASSGGWITWNGGTSVVQAGKGSDKATGANTWRLTFNGGGFSLVNVASGKALEMNGGSKKSGTKIVAADPTGQAAQIFVFEPSSLYGGRYVALQDASGKRAKAGSTNVATVALANSSTAMSQAFFIEQSGKYWKLRDYNGRYVTTTGTSTKTDVVSRADTGKENQLWLVGIADGGKISFKNVQSKLALVSGTTKPQLGQASSAGAGWTLVDRTIDAMKERIAQVATHFAEHDSHGYSQPNRGTGEKEYVVVQDGAKVTISSADVDCSELVRQCVNTVLGYNAIEFMWTGNEDNLLVFNGFVRMAFNLSDVRRGDILWRAGHTGVALSKKKQAEALMDEYGGIYGYNSGDQTGGEVGINAITAGAWTYIYRYVG